MNLNEFVPTHLEDASGVDKHQTIYQLSGNFEKSMPDEFTWRPDIRYGVTKKFQVEVMGDMISGASEVRGGESRASALYQVIESDIANFAINPFVSFPTGKSSDGIDPAIKIILSSNNPDTQIHLNYQIRHNASRRSGERADEILYAAGFSKGFRRSSAGWQTSFSRTTKRNTHAMITLKLGCTRSSHKAFIWGTVLVRESILRHPIGPEFSVSKLKSSYTIL